MIDLATDWFETHQYDDEKSITVHFTAEHEWSSKYPWPNQITYD
jgi:hypothetical protein